MEDGQPWGRLDRNGRHHGGSGCIGEVEIAGVSRGRNTVAFLDVMEEGPGAACAHRPGVRQ